jgi:integrase
VGIGHQVGSSSCRRRWSTQSTAALKDAGLTKRITPHMMRKLFNDVLRTSGVDKVTRKAITGHVTDEMTEHDSRVRLDEKRTAMEAAAMQLRGEKVDFLVDSSGENEKGRPERQL